MRWNLMTNPTIPLVLLAALAAVGRADDPKPDARYAIPLMGQFTRGVVSGDHFYTIADGRLVDADLKRRTTTTFAEPGARLIPFLDVCDGNACVADVNHVHVIDLANGKVVRSVESPDGVRG